MTNIIRAAKNKIKNFAPAEVKVREATSNDPWGPSSTLMHEISMMTHESIMQREQIIEMVIRRLNDHGKNWRHVYKSLILSEYIALTGSNYIYEFWKSNLHLIETLTNFQHFDKDGRDLGINVREKARRFANLLSDHDQFKIEQERAKKTMNKTHNMVHTIHDDISVSYGGGNTSLHGKNQPESVYVSPGSMKKGISQDLKQAIPRNEDEEDAQLQLALAMSKEEVEKDAMRRIAYSGMENLAMRNSIKQSMDDVNAWDPHPTVNTNDVSALHGSYTLGNSTGFEDSLFSSSKAQTTDPFSIPPPQNQTNSHQGYGNSQNVILEDIFSSTQPSSQGFFSDQPTSGTQSNYFDNLTFEQVGATYVSPETTLHQPTTTIPSSSIIQQFLGENSTYVDVSFDNFSSNQNNPFSNPFATPPAKKVTLNELKTNSTVPNKPETTNSNNNFPATGNSDNFFL